MRYLKGIRLLRWSYQAVIYWMKWGHFNLFSNIKMQILRRKPCELPVRTLILLQPVEIKHFIIQILFDLNFVLFPVLIIKGWFSVNYKWSKLHISTVFNYRIWFSIQVKVHIYRVMDSDLMRLQENKTVTGVIYEWSTTATTYIYLTRFDLLHVNAFYCKRKNYNAML